MRHIWEQSILRTSFDFEDLGVLVLNVRDDIDHRAGQHCLRKEGLRVLLDLLQLGLIDVGLDWQRAMGG